jgi:hypothetical protein
MEEREKKKQGILVRDKKINLQSFHTKRKAKNAQTGELVSSYRWWSYRKKASIFSNK